MRRTYKFRMYPTKGQHLLLAACLDSHRELYNAALQERRDAWRMTATGVSYGTQSAQLKEIRSVRPDVALWSFSSQQTTLRRLNKAFASFFRRVSQGRTPGYPRFKGKDRFDSVEWPKDGDGCRWRPESSRVYLQGIGNVKVNAHRLVQGGVKTIQIKREGNKWYLILSCDDVPARPPPQTGMAVGVDAGTTSFATTSGGTHINSPRWARKGREQLEIAQQRLSRKKRGSRDRCLSASQDRQPAQGLPLQGCEGTSGRL